MSDPLKTAREALEHELKTWPEYFSAVEDGSKPFEVRKRDRDFQPGDVLRLREWDRWGGTYTGRELRRRVTGILGGGKFGISDDHCVLGLAAISATEAAPAALGLTEGHSHSSDCALHNAPAMEPGPCDCGAVPAPSWTEEQLIDAWWAGVRAGNFAGDGPSNDRALVAMRAALATLNATPAVGQTSEPADEPRCIHGKTIGQACELCNPFPTHQGEAGAPSREEIAKTICCPKSDCQGEALVFGCCAHKWMDEADAIRALYATPPTPAVPVSREGMAPEQLDELKAVLRGERAARTVNAREAEYLLALLSERPAIEGWKLVPREPDKTMIAAIRQGELRRRASHQQMGASSSEAFQRAQPTDADVWRDMYDAAPAQPEAAEMLGREIGDE